VIETEDHGKSAAFRSVDERDAIPRRLAGREAIEARPPADAARRRLVSDRVRARPKPQSAAGATTPVRADAGDEEPDS